MLTCRDGSRSSKSVPHEECFQPTWVILITVSPCAVCIPITFSCRLVQLSKEDVNVEVAPLSTINAPFIVVLDSLPALLIISIN
jgi:hypothetical protein